MITNTETLSHFDAGLEYLKAIQQPGQRFSQAELAQACGVSAQAIAERESRALRKLRVEHGEQLRVLLEQARDL